MTTTRKTAIALLVLDLLAAVTVFNAVGVLRGISTVSSLVLLPLVAPVVALIVAIYLIEGYKARTDMLSLDYTSQHAIAIMGAMLTTLLLTFAFKIPGGYTLQ
ncbi:MAG TPA: polyprenyl glycosylphosphotransferase, partial [Opitutaceae bacterium]|nr:polyprenyl glycosylphosphotransferase [Opitutaceae bacterium]